MATERALCPTLVGREAELSELEDALLAARRGDGRVVLLAGDAGMGKTRLAGELSERARSLGMEVLVGGCSEADLALPYLPFLEALGNYLAAADIESVRSRLGPVRRELAHLFPQLEPEGVSPDVDSTQGKLRLFEAVLSLLAIPSSDRGLLLVVEDLHWADASTRELVDYLTRRLRSSRIMILGTYRRDEMHRRHPLLPLIQGWRRNSATTIVELAALDGQKIADMVRAIFDIEEVRDDTRDFLLKRTEGNPFVLEEMLKVAVDRGDIYRTATGWDRKALSEMSIPDSVKDTILLRLDRLAPEQVDVLRTAAVLGATFSYANLVAVSQLPDATVQSAVEASVLHQLLEQDPRVARSYRFRHALTREAIYDDMILPHRERLHARAAEHLRASGGRSVDLSHHLLMAGLGAEALPLSLEAAAEAEVAYAFADAAELYQRVLGFVDAGVERSRLLCRLGNALYNAGQSASAHRYLEEGVNGLEPHDPIGAAGFRLALGRCYWELARSPDALREYGQARDILETQGPSADLAVAYIRLAGMRLFQFDAEACQELARRAIEVAEACGADSARIWAYNFLGAGISQAGNDDEGMAWLDRSWEEARKAGLWTIAANGLYNGLGIRMASGRILEIRDRALLFAELPPSPDNNLTALVAISWSDYFEARPAQSLESSRRALAIAEETGNLVWVLRIKAWLASCLVEMDRLAEAAEALPPLAALSEAQERFGRTQTAIRLELARGEPGAAAREAAAVFETADWSASARTPLAAVAVRAFIAVGDLESARRAAALAEMKGRFMSECSAAMLTAELELAEGRAGEAGRSALEVAERLGARGYLLGAADARLIAADALVAEGRIDEAAELLRSLVAEFRPRSCFLIARRASERLLTLGFEPSVTPAPDSPSSTAIGERLVTVLFADVRGYTAMTRDAIPADLAGRIAALQRWAADEVVKERGLVDKFAGDALMATFNVSGTSVDHALHALRAGLALSDKAAALGLPLGVGIATGTAVVGSLAEGANLSVIGEATNLASRLQAQAGRNELLLSEEAHRRLRGWLAEKGIEARAEELELKGYDELVKAHRLVARDGRPA